MAIRRAYDEYVITIIAYAFMAFLSAVMLYPLLNVIAVSLSDYAGYIRNPAMIVPHGVSIAAYRKIFSTSFIVRGYLNTIFVTSMGTAVSMFLTVLTAYPLAKAKVRFSRAIMFFILFTMFFQGGIIPLYLVVRSLGLIDTLWALILPVAMTPFNFLIMKTNMEMVPDSLEESARLEGAGNLLILFRIVLPLCAAVFMALSLFYAVAHWNRFFEAVLYINSRVKWTMALILREIISVDPNMFGDSAEASMGFVYPKTLQNAVIVITVLPIMLVYPLIQRYFMSGVMVGAVKG